MKASKNTIIAVAATLVIAGGGGFYGGMAYAQSLRPKAGFLFQNGGNAPMGANRQRQSAAITGEIISRDDASITVKDRNGSTKIIFFSENASIGKMSEVKAADLAVGENVMAAGSANADGSITASNIQVRPEGAAAMFQGVLEGGSRARVVAPSP